MNNKVVKSGKVALLAGVGGLLGAGIKMLLEPVIFKDSTKIQKYFWVSPATEIVAGAVGGAFDQTAIAGAGLIGAGVAHLVEGANLAISIKKNAAASGAPATTTTTGDVYDAGSLVMPNQFAPSPSVGALMPSSPDLSRSFYNTGSLRLNRAA